MVLNFNSSFKVCADKNSQKDRECRVNLHIDGDSASVEYIKNSIPTLSKAISDLAVDSVTTQLYK